MVNILIIEDSKAFAKGLSMLISQFEEIDQVYRAHTYEDAMDLLKISEIRSN
jgi:response regulator of citrate/malate metabolism